METAPLVQPNEAPLPSTGCETFKDAPDDHPIHLSPEWEPVPGQALIHEAAEFPKLYAALYFVAGLGYHPDYIQTVVRHEGQHADAAKKLGAKESLFGLELQRIAQSKTDTEGELTLRLAFHAAINHKVTKLGLALTKAYPSEGIEGDLRSVKALGYTGVQQLGDRALEYNRAHGPVMPIPLSYDASLHE